MVLFLIFQIYETSLRLTLHHLVDRALICQTSAESYKCREKFLDKLNYFSSQMKLQEYQIRQISNQLYRADVRVELPLQRQLHIQRELRWNRLGPLL